MPLRISGHTDLHAVNIDDFPSYLKAVGGEDQMMDIGTMQSKIDLGEYKSMDEIEASVGLFKAVSPLIPLG